MVRKAHSPQLIPPPVRAAFQDMTEGGAGDAGALAAGMRRATTSIGMRALAAKLLHVAVCAPERVADVYDSAAHGWLFGEAFPPTSRYRRREPLPAAFWDLFWRLVEQPLAARRRIPFTLATLSLAGRLDVELSERVALTALVFPGVREAVSAGLLEGIRASDFALHSSDSLGGAVYLQALQKGELGEIVDASALELAKLPQPLGYLNARVLESHLVWAVVGGYGAAEIDDVALASFQAAQFAHHYSTLLLGLTMASLAFERPVGLEYVVDAIFRGWLHGRQTRLLLPIAWSQLWDCPVKQVREDLGIVAFASPLTDLGRADAAMASASRLFS